MKIALIMENSQAQKNASVENALKKAVLPYGYEVVNYGMFNEKDDPLTYVQNGILAAILLNSKTADYVVTGCGTGEGAMLACNAFPGVLCGHIEDPWMRIRLLRSTMEMPFLFRLRKVLAGEAI